MHVGGCVSRFHKARDGGGVLPLLVSLGPLDAGPGILILVNLQVSLPSFSHLPCAPA